MKKEFPALEGVLSRSVELVRPLSALMIVICTAMVIWSSVRLLIDSAKTMAVPKFSSIEKRFEAVGAEARTMTPEQFVALQEQKEVEEKYEAKIVAMMEERGLSGGDKVIIFKRMQDLEPKHRSTFLKGMDRFLADATKFNEKLEQDGGGSGIDIPDAANRYADLFTSAMKDAQASQEDLAEQRAARARTLSNSVGLLMFFLIAPLLIQIAENTKKS